MTSSLEKWYKIGDVCNVTDFVANGSFESLRNNVEYLHQKDYAILIRLRDFNNKWKPPYVYVSKESYDFLSKSNLEPGDVIVSNIGDPGVVFRVPDLDRKMTLGPNSLVCKVEHSNELLDKDFLYYYLNSHYCQWEIKSRIGGSAQPKFNKTDFRNIKIRLPSKAQQISSVRLVANFDKMINNNTKKIEKILHSITGLFRSWFIDFDPVNAKSEGKLPYGMDDETAALFPDTCEESELGLIPSGWKIGSLSDLSHMFDINPEVIDSSFNNKQINYIDISSIGFGFFKTAPKKINYQEAPSRARRIVRDGDILISTVRPKRKSLIFIHKPQINTVASTGFAQLRAKDSYFSYFLLGLVINPMFTKELEMLAYGAAYPAVSTKDIYRVPFAIPPISVIEKFGEIIESAILHLGDLHEYNRSLEEIKTLLLPRLMSGELKLN